MRTICKILKQVWDIQFPTKTEGLIEYWWIYIRSGNLQIFRLRSTENKRYKFHKEGTKICERMCMLSKRGHAVESRQAWWMGGLTLKWMSLWAGLNWSRQGFKGHLYFLGRMRDTFVIVMICMSKYLIAVLPETNPWWKDSSNLTNHHYEIHQPHGLQILS